MPKHANLNSWPLTQHLIMKIETTVYLEGCERYWADFGSRDWRDLQWQTGTKRKKKPRPKACGLSDAVSLAS